MKKKLITCALLACSIFPTVAQAKTIEFILDNQSMHVSENFEIRKDTLPAAPFILNDRTMIPARAVSEQYGATVSWDAPTRTVSIKTESADIRLVIDDTTAYVNGKAVLLDAAPVIRGDITFIPVRFVTENLGYYVNFVPRTRSILITDQKPLMVNNAPVYDYEVNDIYYIFATEQGAEITTTTAYNTAIQNSIFAGKAKDHGITLTEEDNATLDALIAAKPYPPLLDGELAWIYEKDLLCTKYIKAITEEKKDAADVLAYYEENYLCAKHILISRIDDAAKKKATDIAKKAKKGEDFDTLVKEYGEDPGMVANPDGYVFTSGEMVPSFEDGTRSLKPGEISAPVLSEYGYHIIKREFLPKIPDDVMQTIVAKLYLIPIIENTVITQ